MGNIFAGAGKMALDFGTQSVQSASSFQQSMLKNVASAGLSKDAYQSMSNAILTMSPQVGQAPLALSNSLFQVLSAGVQSSQVLATVKLAAEDAAIGMTSSTVTASALTAEMQDFGVTAQQASDMLVASVGHGKFTIEQYANSIGKLGSTAHTANISMAETNAALDVLSYTFPSAAQASTGLSSLLTIMDIKTDTLAQHAKKLGIAFDETKFKTLDLAGQVAYLDKITGNNPGLQASLLGQKNALQSLQALTNASDQYKSTLVSLKNTQGATADAFKTTSEGFAFQMTALGDAVDVVKIKLGTALLPVLTGVAKAITPIIMAFGDWVTSSGIVQNALNVVTTAVQWVGTALGGLWQQIQPIVTEVAPLFNDLASAAVGWGQNLIGGFISGVNAMAGPLIAEVEQIAQSIADFLGFASPAKKGPGSKLNAWGPNLVKGLAGGIAGESPAVKQSITSLTKYFESIGYNAKSATALATNEIKTGLSAGMHGGAKAVEMSTQAIEKSLMKMGLSVSVAMKAASVAMAGGLTTQIDQINGILPSSPSTKTTKGHSSHGAGGALGGGGGLADSLQSLHKNMASLGSSSNTIASVIKPIKDLGTTVTHAASSVSKAVTAIRNDFNALKNFLAPTIKEVGSLLGGEFSKNFKFIEDTGKQFSSWFKADLLPAIKSAMPGFQNLAGTIVQDVVPAVLKIWDAAQDLGRTLLSALLPVIEHIIPPVVQFAGVIADGLGKAIKFIAPYVVEAAQAIAKFAGDIATRITPIIIKFWDMFVTGMHEIKQIWDVLWPYLAPILKGVWDEIVGVVKIAWALVTGIIKIGLDILSGNWSQAWTDMKDMLGGIWDGIKTFVKGGINILIGLINGFIRGIDAIHISIPGVIDWQPSIPQIPQFANGVQNFRGGLAIVGERGPELLQLPGGSSVYPMQGGGSSSTQRQTIVLEIDGRAFAEATVDHYGQVQHRRIQLRTGVR